MLWDTAAYVCCSSCSCVGALHCADAAKALLERVVSMMQQEYSAGCPYR
jgi:hypothetical protein